MPSELICYCLPSRHHSEARVTKSITYSQPRFDSLRHLRKPRRSLSTQKKFISLIGLMDQNAALKKFKDNPKKVLDNARKGGMLDLIVLVDFWHEAGPKLLSMGVLSVFFYHLNKALPEVTTVEVQLTVERAFMALLGLSKAGNFITDEDEYGEETMKAWPDVLKWSAYFYKARIQTSSIDPQVKQSTIEIISSSWYSLARSDTARKVMGPSEGAMELATQMWILEDAGPQPSVNQVPTASAALYTLLMGNSNLIDRVVQAAGGNPNNVVNLALSRLRSAVKAGRIHEPCISVYLHLIAQLSQAAHQLHDLFLGADIIVQCTTIALNTSKSLNAGGPSSLLDSIIAAFRFLKHYLESTDGFTWVSQAVQAGLLTAFVDSSPHFSKFGPNDYSMIVIIIKDILPKYLVYRSVIQAVDDSIKKLGPISKDRIKKSVVSDLWDKFHDLAIKRLLLTSHVRAMKGREHVAGACDNVKCHKVDLKNNMRQCSSCSTSLYCSKECQVVDWKEGGHKTLCILKQQDDIEGKYHSMAKGDAAFFHKMAIRDARHHLPYLRNLARQEFPGIANNDFVICNDYLETPTKFSLIPLSECQKQSESLQSVNAKARNEALIERVRENPGKFTAIQSKIARGRAYMLLLTIENGCFLEEG